MKVICSSDESLYRPEVVRWRQRMSMMQPLGDVVVALPCSMKKPYSNSQSHQRFRRATKGYQEVIVTSPFGICPRELENTFPIQSYDVAVSGDWNDDEIRLAGELLRDYVGDKPVIANVEGGYEEVCREYLDNCTYVCENGRPTSPESIFNLREELKKYPKTKHRDRVLNELRSVAKYQFGKEAEAIITDDVVAKGRYHRTLYSNGKTLALLNRDVGLYTLNLEGGRRLAELGIHVVEIDFDLKTNTLFAPGIVDADSNILPKDEVVVVRNDEVVAVGKAVLTGKEMVESRNGVGVKIRHRIKN